MTGSYRQKRNYSSSTSNSSSRLFLLGSSFAVATLAYTTYKYLTNDTIVKEDNSNKNTVNNKDTTDVNIDSNRLRIKHNKNTSISLVISKSILKQIEDYNIDNEDGIDLQNYLENYPNLVMILYPGLDFKDIEIFFKINDSFKHRILKTGVEESVFHLLKQINSDINMIFLQDFKIDDDLIDKNFHLKSTLSNLVTLNDENFFIDII